MKRVALVVALSVWVVDDEFSSGVRAYEDGRYREAFEALAEAERNEGHGASAELVFDVALAALAAGDLRAAEAAAERAAARGGAAFRSTRDFLLGNAAFARGAWASAEAEQTDADPTALVRALAHVRAARDHWMRAASGPTDWPAARRNVERALLRIDELTRLQEEAARNRTAKQKPPAPTPQPEDRPPPDTEEAPDPREEPPAPQAAAPTLTVGELELLLDRLEALERDKRALRQARRSARAGATERDW